MGLLLSFCIAVAMRRPKTEVVAIAIETCFQNTGIALTIALSTFEGEDRANAVGVPLTYNAVQVALLAIFALVMWQADWTHASAKTNIVRCILGNFQPRTPREARPDGGATEPGPASLEAAPPATGVPGKRPPGRRWLPRRTIASAPTIQPARIKVELVPSEEGTADGQVSSRSASTVADGNTAMVQERQALAEARAGSWLAWIQSSLGARQAAPAAAPATAGP